MSNWYLVAGIAGMVSGWLVGIPAGRWVSDKHIAALNRRNPDWYMAPSWHPYGWVPGWPRPSNV